MPSPASQGAPQKHIERHTCAPHHAKCWMPPCLRRDRPGATGDPSPASTIRLLRMRLSCKVRVVARTRSPPKMGARSPTWICALLQTCCSLRARRSDVLVFDSAWALDRTHCLNDFFTAIFFLAIAFQKAVLARTSRCVRAWLVSCNQSGRKSPLLWTRLTTGARWAPRPIAPQSKTTASLTRRSFGAKRGRFARARASRARARPSAADNLPKWLKAQCDEGAQRHGPGDAQWPQVGRHMQMSLQDSPGISPTAPAAHRLLCLPPTRR